MIFTTEKSKIREDVAAMVKLYDSGVYLLNGKDIVSEKELA